VRRITILLATVTALLLVPAAQAFAAGFTTVEIVGSGKGKVSSVNGLGEVIWGGAQQGNPAIECKYASPGPATGTCKNETAEDFYEGDWLRALPAPGSEFAGWTIIEGHRAALVPEENTNCRPTPGNAKTTGFEDEHGEGHAGETEVEQGLGPEAFNGPPCSAEPEEFGGEVVVRVAFNVCGEGCGPSGPTNRRTLTVTKNANGPGGTGSVSSKPKGIKCGTTCTSAVADMYKNTPVELTEKPGTTSTFVEWTGACSGSSPTCTVPMSEDEEVGAVFTGTSKELNPAEALTVSKGESSGKGTVKGPGLGCEAECTSTVVLFQGPITGEKPKPGKTVILKQAPAFGSEFSGWSGCDSVTEAGECVIEMDEAHTITAEYEALPNKVLTVNKEYAKGNGSVSSKPKGIKCGTACTQAVAQMPEGAVVELTAKPSTGTFVEWEGGACDESTSLTCTVVMSSDQTTKAVFSDPSKALPSEATLTLNKEGSAFGTVKAAGLGCELLCSSTSVVYQGPITGEKPKPGKTVVLKAVSAPGSQTVVWSGCDSETEAGECVVEMDENHSVTATFDELE